MVRESSTGGMTMISELAEDDLPSCAEVFRTTFREPPWNEDWPPETAHRRLAELLSTPNALGLCARDGSAVVGFVLGFVESFHPGDRYHLAEMAVLPAQQRRGIGGDLVAELRSRLDAVGVRDVYLVTGREGPTREFWEDTGLRPSRSRIVMAASISSPATAP